MTFSNEPVARKPLTIRFLSVQDLANMQTGATAERFLYQGRSIQYRNMRFCIILRKCNSHCSRAVNASKRWPRCVTNGTQYHHSKRWASKRIWRMDAGNGKKIFDAINRTMICLKTRRHTIPASQIRHWMHRCRSSFLWWSIKDSVSYDAELTVRAAANIVELFVKTPVILKIMLFLDMTVPSIKVMRKKCWSSRLLAVASSWDPSWHSARFSQTHRFHILQTAMRFRPTGAVILRYAESQFR